MTRRAIAWYVHHHGMGHLTRMRAVAAHLEEEIVCFSSLPRPTMLPSNCTWMQLERDDDVEPGSTILAADRSPTAGGMLHWAPELHTGHRRRLVRMARVIDQHPVSAFVVDTSVEVTLFARLLGIPPVLFTQPGTRHDEPHALGLRAAARIVAPWPAELLRPAHLAPVQSSVVFTGGISRFDGRVAGPRTRDGVLVLGGRGGTQVVEADLATAAAATPGERWVVLGGLGGSPGKENDWTDDPWESLLQADVTVSWAGQNAVADLAASRARAVIVPQWRPFDEQLETARALGRAGLAVVEPIWPSAERWPEVLESARAREADWSRWEACGAAERAARVVHDVGAGRAE